MLHTLGYNGKWNIVGVGGQQTVFFEKLGDMTTRSLSISSSKVSAPVARPGTSSLDATQTPACPSHSALTLYCGMAPIPQCPEPPTVPGLLQYALAMRPACHMAIPGADLSAGFQRKLIGRQQHV
jgi:hypothetical protein